MSAVAWVYRLRDVDDQLLYVGRSTHPARRFTEHASSKSWWGDVRRIDLEPYLSTQSAADSERAAIEQEAPMHNTIRYGVGERAIVIPADAPTAEHELAHLTARYDAGVAELRQAIRDGINSRLLTEASAARASGLDRMTVRRIMGKTR